MSKDYLSNASKTDQYLEGRISALESYCTILSTQLFTLQVAVSNIPTEEEVSAGKTILENVAGDINEAINLADKDQPTEYERGFLDGMKELSEKLQRASSRKEVEE